MASTRFYIQSSNKSAPIYLRFSDSNKFNLKRKTGLVLNPSDWSKKTHYPITKDKITKEIKSQLLKLENFILDRYNEVNIHGQEINGIWLEKQISVFFNRTDYTNPFETVFGVIDYIIKNAHSRKNGKGGVGLSYNRLKGYKNLKVVLSKFTNNNDIAIKSINKSYIDLLTDWMLHNEKYKISTTNKKISDLKGICFEAESHGTQISSQIRHIKNLSNNEKNKVIILSTKELEIISNTHIANDSLNNVKTWLLFGCEIGQRLDDLLKITTNNIHNSDTGNFRLLKLTQGKGKKPIEIPLSPKAESTIKSGLPYEISKPIFNKQVKKLCLECGINEEIEHTKLDPETNRKKPGVYKKYELITGHTCRRSFASNYYGTISNSLLMKVTGHAQERTFMKYIGKSDEDFTNLIYEQMIKSSVS